MKSTLLAGCKLGIWTWLLLITGSCYGPIGVKMQYDEATNTKNFRWEHRAAEMKLRSPLVYVDQAYVKQHHSDQSVTYRLYDVVVLHENEFRLNDQIFMLLDNSPITLVPERREDDNWRTRDAKREEILTADSTKISVVTGYQENNYRVTRLEYHLAPEVIEQIQAASSIQFRYYSGSHIITISLTTEKVNRLKKLFAS
jgi:hypothetical protein